MGEFLIAGDNEKKNRKEIILIGPVGVGKTTVSNLLSQKLNLPKVSMDDLLFQYMTEVGFQEAHWKEIIEKQGKTAGYRYLKVFGSYAVTRLLESHKDCIFDFGGGGVMGEFPDEFDRMKLALEPFENIVFLIPSPDKAESLQFLYDRMKLKPNGWTVLEHIVFHPSHELLAKQIVYTKGKTPEDIAEDIIRLTASGQEVAPIKRHKGSCLCGAIRFDVEGELKAPDACHCSQCRKQSGHFFASTDIALSALKIHGAENIKWFSTSEKERRGFCSHCGSSLFWDPIHADWIAIAMGAFDSPTGTKLAKHIFVANKGDYYTIADGLPQNAQ